MYMNFCFVIGFNIIADLDIDLELNYRLYDSFNKKYVSINKSSLLAI